MTNYQKPLSIKVWAEEDRPREKMIRIGKKQMSNSELLAILISSGTKEESALDLSKRILSSVSNDLNKLGKLSHSDLLQFKGIGNAKAITISAALELGGRRQRARIGDQPKILTSKDAHDSLFPLMQDLTHEEFWVLYLNRANKIIVKERISSGGISGTVVDARMIFKKGLEVLASSLILCHNHPSGNLSPSQQDIKLTKKLVQAGEVLDIRVVDHLIVSDYGYFSFADEGVL